MDTRTFCDFRILRDLRKRERMSIEELSQKSGISPSVISKLERNRNIPEMDTLYRIARVFSLTLADLISLAENRSSHSVEEEQYPSGGFRFRRVVYENMRCMYAEAEAGAATSRPSVHRNDYELCWVLEGTLRLKIQNGNEHLLHAGDSIQFDALLEHSLEAVTPVKLIITHIRKGKTF